MTVDTTAWRLLGTYVDATPDCGSPRGAAFGYSFGDRNPERLQANAIERARLTFSGAPVQVRTETHRLRGVASPWISTVSKRSCSGRLSLATRARALIGAGAQAMAS